jgi:hypothetical protein
VRTVYADGRSTTVEFVYDYDKQEHPVTGPSASGLRDARPRHSPVGMYGLDWRASIRYYTDRRVTPLATPDDLNEYQARNPNALRADASARLCVPPRAGCRIHEVVGRPAIVGRPERYFRRQISGRLVVVTLAKPLGPWRRTTKI